MFEHLANVSGITLAFDPSWGNSPSSWFSLWLPSCRPASHIRVCTSFATPHKKQNPSQSSMILKRSWFFFIRSEAAKLASCIFQTSGLLPFCSIWGMHGDVSLCGTEVDEPKSPTDRWRDLHEPGDSKKQQWIGGRHFWRFNTALRSEQSRRLCSCYLEGLISLLKLKCLKF